MDAAKTGALITQARKEKNLTQKDLAQALHVSVQAVSKWERGLNFPDIALLEPLAEKLGLTVSELLSGERNAPAGEELVRSSLRMGLKQLGGRVRKWRGSFFAAAAVLLCLGLWSGYVWVRDNTEWLPQRETVITPRLLTSTEYQSIRAAGQDMVFFYDVALADGFGEYAFALELWTADGLQKTWPLDHHPLDTQPPMQFSRHQTMAVTLDFWAGENSGFTYGLNFLQENCRDSMDDLPFDLGDGVAFHQLKERTAVQPEHGVILLSLIFDPTGDGWRAPISSYVGDAAETPHVYEEDAVVLLRMTVE